MSATPAAAAATFPRDALRAQVFFVLLFFFFFTVDGLFGYIAKNTQKKPSRPGALRTGRGHAPPRAALAARVRGSRTQEA